MEKFSIENESSLNHNYSDSHIENHIREEVDILLNDKELLKKRRGEIWKGAHDILDDLIDIVLERIMEKHEAIEKYPRELVRKIIAEHGSVELKESEDKLNLNIKGVIVAESNIGALKKYGMYPKK